MYKFIALTVLLALSGTEAFHRCCANQPNAVCPSAITSPSCSGDRCTVRRGDTLLADATFTPVRAHQRLDVEVTATALGISIPLPPPGDNACDSLFRNGVQVGCPTVPNVAHVWRIDFPIPTTIPAFNTATVRYMLRENGVMEACVDVTATIL